MQQLQASGCKVRSGLVVWMCAEQILLVICKPPPRFLVEVPVWVFKELQQGWLFKVSAEQVISVPSSFVSFFFCNAVYDCSQLKLTSHLLTGEAEVSKHSCVCCFFPLNLLLFIKELCNLKPKSSLNWASDSLLLTYMVDLMSKVVWCFIFFLEQILTDMFLFLWNFEL